MLKKHLLFYDFKNKTFDEKVYDMIHIICFFGMIFACFLVNYFFDDTYPLYISYGIALLFFVTMLEGNRTGRRKLCSFIMAIILNFFYLPLLFSTYGKFVCVIPFYFLIGIVYTLLVLDVKPGLGLAVAEVVFYSVYIYLFGENKGIDYVPSDLEFENVYGATIAAFFLVSIFLGAVIRYKYLVYAAERNNATELHERAVQEFISRDMFLINMSHEIRTPMNAIVGNANLLLDDEADNKIKDNIYQILNSCSALLLILNELMDLSKIDSQEVEVYNTRYDFKEMISEIINIVSVKLTESQLEFFVDLNRDIPRFLVGDVSKIRQLLINILSNAIKFTESGYIELSIDYEKVSDEIINIVFVVKDTGIGMDEEYLKSLFDEGDNDEIIYLDDNSGLGLWTCNQLINKLGGSINAKSSKGKGSEFTFCVPQNYENEKLISKELDKEIRILLIEKNEFVSKRVKQAIDGLNIKCDIALSRIEFDEKLSNNTYTHIFVAYERLDECDVILQRKKGNSKLFFITDIGESVDTEFSALRLIRPVNAINIIGAINGEYDDTPYNRTNKKKFAIPGVNVLIVDDNYTNLDVASALLSKYEASIVTSSSGKDAIRLLGEQDFDLIFMDYMMPDLNGVDTLNIIRAMPDEKYKTIPVVALSANVVSGAYEMFIQSGFNAFIPKPINVSKLENALLELLPEEKIIEK